MTFRFSFILPSSPFSLSLSHSELRSRRRHPSKFSLSFSLPLVLLLSMSFILYRHSLSKIWLWLTNPGLVKLHTDSVRFVLSISIEIGRGSSKIAIEFVISTYLDIVVMKLRGLDRSVDVKIGSAHYIQRTDLTHFSSE